MSMWQYISQCQKVGGALIRGGAIFGGNTVYISPEKKSFRTIILFIIGMLKIWPTHDLNLQRNHL